MPRITTNRKPLGDLDHPRPAPRSSLVPHIRGRRQSSVHPTTEQTCPGRGERVPGKLRHLDERSILMPE